VIGEHLRARFDPSRRFLLVLDLLRDDRLDSLFEPPVPFAEAPAAYANANDRARPQIVFAY
jgi:hypothetical protein